MPYKKRSLAQFRDWEPDEHFDATVDRLLVTTSLDQTFVVRANPSGGQANDLVMDKEFMPFTLDSLPLELELCWKMPSHWSELEQSSAINLWQVFVYDGESTPAGTFLTLEAAGPRWSRTILSTVIIKRIEPVHVNSIDRENVARELGGLIPREFAVDEGFIQFHAFND